MYGLNTWLAQESEFYPVFAMGVVLPENSRRVDFQIEVTYNLVFRGVQSVNTTGGSTPGVVAPFVTMCSKGNRSIVDIEEYAFIHNIIKRRPDGQDANWLYRTFKRYSAQNATVDPTYGDVHFDQYGVPIMTVQQGAGSATGYLMPFKMRKTDSKNSLESFATGNGTLGATPNPQELLTVDNNKLETYRKLCQSLTVDDSMMSETGSIHAIGYVDLNANDLESNDSYVQDKGSSNRIAWRSVNGVTTPATLRELNIKNSGPQYVGAVTDPVLTFNEEDPAAYTLTGLPFHDNGGSLSGNNELWDPALAFDVSKMHNFPWDPALAPHDVVNYNSRLASHLWVEVWKNGVPVMNSRITGQPTSATTDFIHIVYNFVGTTELTSACNVSIMMFPGSYPIDFLQQMFNYLQGLTTYPLWYGSDVETMTPLTMPNIPQDETAGDPFTGFVQFLAGMISSNGLVQGVVWNRIKGFFKKISRVLIGKVLPVVKPLVNVAASVLPGPANLVVSKLLDVFDTASTAVNTVALSNDKVTTIGADGAVDGDAFMLTQQVHVCELDVNDEPIVLDTVTSDDTLWQSAGDSIPVYVNSTVAASGV